MTQREEEHMRTITGQLERLAVLLEQFKNREQTHLACAECGATDDNTRGWTLRRDIDDDLAAFCPECDLREFGDA